MNVVKHLFALGILVSPLAASADPGVADTNAPESVSESSVSESAVAPVQVTFTNPEKFLDASPHRYGAKERDATLQKLARHMQGQGARYLKPGQILKIEVLNVDLAGRVEWWHANAHDLRIMRDIDSPAMKVRYSLEENGVVLASAEEWIADRMYLMGASVLGGSSDSLKYEKAMLNDWFRHRFGSNQS